MSSLAAEKQAAFWVLKISLILMVLGLTGLSFDLPAQGVGEVSELAQTTDS